MTTKQTRAKVKKTIDKSRAIEAVNYETMTSLEVAKLTGMRHDHLLRDIRKMERGWVETNHPKFGGVDYVDAKGEKRPMFVLGKKEWVYIATKFNDAARARLIDRWEELEKENLKRMIEREKEKEARRYLTDAIRDSGENERMHGHAYSVFTDMIYKRLFNRTAKQLREELGLKKNESIKDRLSSEIVKKMNGLEGFVKQMLDMDMDFALIKNTIQNMPVTINITADAIKQIAK